MPCTFVFVDKLKDAPVFLDDIMRADAGLRITETLERLLPSLHAGVMQDDIAQRRRRIACIGVGGGETCEGVHGTLSKPQPLSKSQRLSIPAQIVALHDKGVVSVDAFTLGLCRDSKRTASLTLT